MLQKMRAFAKSWVASVFLLLVVGSFTLWGVADVFRGGSDTDVVSMNTQPIAYDTFVRDYRNILKNESQRTGRDITTDEARKLGIGNTVVQQMIDRAALDKAIDDLHLTTGDADVSERVRQIDAFKGPLGTFDKDTFDRALQQRGYNEKEFVETIRGDMTRSQLMATLESGFAVPPGYAHALFSFSTELRAAEYVVFNAASLPPVAPPGDQVLAAYIKAHPERFSTPEYRDVTVASIGVEDFLPTIKVTEQQLKNEYEVKKATYVVPEKRDVQQIAYPTEAAAVAAKAKIDAGMPFETAASLAGQTIDDRGTVDESDLGPLGKAAFAVPVNGVTAPQKNFATWVLMRVTKITPGKEVTFDQAKADLTTSLMDQLAKGKLVDVENAYGDANNEGLDIEESAKKTGMHITHVAAVDAQGLTPDGTRAPLPADADLLKHIFDADIGEPTDAFQTTNGRVFAVSVKGVTPPKLKSLEAARADATRVWTSEQNAKRLRERAAALTAKATKDGSLAEVAKELGAPVLTGQALNREKPPEMFSAQLLQSIFEARPGMAVSGPATAPGGFIIARVTGVAHPTLSPLDPRYRQGIQQLGRQVADDITSSFAKDERSKMNVRINQKLLNQAIGGGEGS